jgi:macrodomain Ter protein organizer (MatP/YcbG family)
MSQKDEEVEIEVRGETARMLQEEAKRRGCTVSEMIARILKETEEALDAKA